MNLNDFAAKLTVTSRSQRNLITNNHLLDTKMTLDAPGKLQMNLHLAKVTPPLLKN